MGRRRQIEAPVAPQAAETRAPSEDLLESRAAEVSELLGTRIRPIKVRGGYAVVIPRLADSEPELDQPRTRGEIEALLLGLRIGGSYDWPGAAPSPEGPVALLDGGGR